MTNLAHGVKASELCSTGKKHLYSTHSELHQENAYVKRFGANSNHLGHIILGQYIPQLVKQRHEELAHEIDFRAKQSRTAGGHQSDIDPVMTVDPELISLPVSTLKLYQRNVFRCKDCNCMEEN